MSNQSVEISENQMLVLVAYNQIIAVIDSKNILRLSAYLFRSPEGYCTDESKSGGCEFDSAITYNHGKDKIVATLNSFGEVKSICDFEIFSAKVLDHRADLYEVYEFEVNGEQKKFQTQWWLCSWFFQEALEAKVTEMLREYQFSDIELTPVDPKNTNIPLAYQLPREQLFSGHAICIDEVCVGFVCNGKIFTAVTEASHPKQIEVTDNKLEMIEQDDSVSRMCFGSMSTFSEPPSEFIEANAIVNHYFEIPITWPKSGVAIATCAVSDTTGPIKHLWGTEVSFHEAKIERAPYTWKQPTVFNVHVMDKVWQIDYQENHGTDGLIHFKKLVKSAIEQKETAACEPNLSLVELTGDKRGVVYKLM
jgi:hypothetical protein